MTTFFAPAKVNLTLHVTGQRDDGYHLLDSLVCFPDVGDVLSFQPAKSHRLDIHGAPELESTQDNLVLRAAHLFLPDAPQHIELHKALPISSGIGGGSANAAAVIRYAMTLDPTLADSPNLIAKATTLGADVPVCIASRPQRFEGIGDILTPAVTWPMDGYILLVNPRVAVSTPAVFKALGKKNNPAMPSELPRLDTLDALVTFIGTHRNDLQGPAIAEQPIIAEVLDQIVGTQNCLFVRMSGSGATCFGLYRSYEDVLAAAAEVGSNNPDWWVDYGALQQN